MMMSKRRKYYEKIILGLWSSGAILGTAVLLFPPWRFVGPEINAEGLHLELNRPGPFASIFNIPPIPVDKISSGEQVTGEFFTKDVHAEVDLLRLIVVMLAICVMCGIPIYVLRQQLEEHRFKDCSH